MLKVSGLRKRYGPVLAVDGIAFEVVKGQCYGLLGPNGAGKTTTISMIVGAAAPDEGSITLGGDPVGMKGFAAKRRLGYVPQELALYEDLNAHDNLRFFGALYGLGGDELNQRMAEALQLVELQDRAKEPVRNFSGGMKRRLNIAAALLHRPEFMVLDEPTVGVDPQSRNAIFESLKNLQSQGLTLLYTTHYMEEVERLCDRVAVMDHGKILVEDTIAGLRRTIPHGNRVRIELAGAPYSLEKAPFEFTIENDVLTTEIEDLAEGLPPVLAAIKSSGAQIVGVESSKTNMEDVFLHLTGRTLRD